MEKRAVILAGGQGSRLRPYTVVLPKPLMPIGDFPILEVIIRQLARHGFTRITIAVNHQAEIIQAYCGNGSKWNVSIDYSLEDRPLSTMAPLRLIRDLPEDFLVLNGDVLTDLNFAHFYQAHVEQRNLFTVSAFAREVKSEFGILHLDPAGKLRGFEEKPVSRHIVSMGVYMVNRAALEIIPAEGPYGFDHLMLEMIRRDTPADVIPWQGYWLDIGRADDYLQAIAEFEEKRAELLP